MIKKMNEKDSKVKTSMVFHRKIYKEAKKYAIDKDMTVSELIESLLRKEMERDEKNE